MTDSSLSDTLKSTTSDAADAVAEKATDAADAVQKTADKAAAKTAGAVATGADKVSATAADVSTKAGKAADAATASAVPTGVGGTKEPVPERSLEEIEADLDATRARLAGRIDELQAYVTPRNLMNRSVAKAKGVFVDEYGGIKPDRVLIAAGVVAVVVGLRILRRRRRA